VINDKPLERGGSRPRREMVAASAAK